MSTPTISSHPVEARNRLAKAQRIVAFLDHHMPNVTAETLMLLDDASWLRINTLMAEDLRPSKALISTVVSLVRGREMAMAAVKGALKS